MTDAWGHPAAPGPPPRQGLSPRATIWIIAGVALVAVLIRTHQITTFEILLVCTIVPSVILHEVSHGAMALFFGDDTAKRAGRLTLNPIRHIDPFGTIILPILLVLSGVGAIAYAKPVPVNVSRLRNSRELERRGVTGGAGGEHRVGRGARLRLQVPRVTDSTLGSTR